MGYDLGIDIGGTSIKIGVTDNCLRLIYKDSFPTRTKDGERAIMDDLKAKCREIKQKFDISHIGVGCPGDKDEANVSILRAGNLPFINLPIVKELEEIFEKDVFLDNDGNCALIAEWLCGSGKGLGDMVMVTIGTGIGGGCIVNRGVLRGVDNDGGELGHFSIDPDGPNCPCGQKGCFERFASASALIDATVKAARSNPGSLLSTYCERQAVDGTTVFAALRGGCRAAEDVLEEYGARLATGLNGLCYIFAPELLVLAGGITKEGETLLRFVRPKLIFPEKVKISSLGGDAGMLGASHLHIFADYYLSLRKQ